MRLHNILTAAMMLAASLTMTGCIEPDLHLAGDISSRLHITINVDTTFRSANTDYTEPSNFEYRHWSSQLPSASDDSTARNEHLDESMTIFTRSLNRDATIGHHHLVAWSNISSQDGTQVLTINESGGTVTASTTIDPDGRAMGLTGYADSIGIPSVRHMPEMFFAGDTAFDITADELGVLDESKGEYVREIPLNLRPRVYSYEVEIILEGNDGHITGTTGQTVITSMASGVDVATGFTSSTPCGVYFPTKADGDTIRGRLNTFGLCAMPPMADGTDVAVGRPELHNNLFFTLTFINGTTKTYRIDVTKTVRENIYSWRFRIVLDATKFKTPDRGETTGGGTTFNPTVVDYEDVVHEFTM